MPTCLKCDVKFSDGAVCCDKCGAAPNSSTLSTFSPPQVASSGSPASPKTPDDVDLSARLEKAMRRAELLGYAVASLGIAILFAIIGIAFV